MKFEDVRVGDVYEEPLSGRHILITCVTNEQGNYVHEVVSFIWSDDGYALYKDKDGWNSQFGKFPLISRNNRVIVTVEK